MAYAATVTITHSANVNGRRYLVVTVAETEANSTSEYSFSVPFLVGTIASLKATRTAGTGTTIQPMIGTATGVAVSTQAREYQAPAAAAHQREAPMRSFYGPILYVRSTPNNAASDHTITTEWIIAGGINDSQDVSADTDLAAIAASVATSATQNTTTATQVTAAAVSVASIDTKATTGNTNTGTISTNTTTANTELARLTGGKLDDQGGTQIAVSTTVIIWTYSATVKKLTVSNTHATVGAHLSADAGASATTSDMYLPPGTTYEYLRGDVPSRSLYAVAASGTVNLNVTAHVEA